MLYPSLSIKQRGKAFTEEILEHRPQPCSAQMAELQALTAACVLGKGRTVNIYTDSVYAHGVCLLFGAVWKQQDLKRVMVLPSRITRKLSN